MKMCVPGFALPVMLLLRTKSWKLPKSPSKRDEVNYSITLK
jgi:hypothetical protein